MDYFVNLTNNNEKEEFLKTRTDSLMLPRNIKNTLLESDIRTVRGLISKTPSELERKFGFKNTDLVAVTRSLDRLAGKIARHSLKSPDSRMINSTFISTQKISQNEAEQIIDMFATYFNIEKHILVGRNRQQEIVFARDIIVYILRTYGDLSFPAIARLLGGRDHTTVMHAYSKIEQQVKSNEDFESEFKDLIRAVGKFKEHAFEIERLSKPSLKYFPRSYILAEKRSRPIQITKRSLEILNLYRQGLILEDIGKRNGITRERARQIIAKTIKQLAFNESLSTGIEVDFDTFFAKEKELRRLLIEGKKPVKQPKHPKIYKWSVYYNSCKGCGTTEIKHYKHGLCEECGNKSITGHAREQMISEHSNKCDLCNKSREQTILEYERDFYLIRKTKRVLCRGCFLQETGKKLADSKRNRWKMFFN